MSQTLAREIYPEASDRLEQYAQLLATDGLTRGLIGPNELERLWARHILNSALIEELVPQAAGVVDVGSGAGLPGLVLAIVRPDIKVSLVDNQARRVRFLTEAIDRLGLERQCRAEQGRVPDYWQAAAGSPPTVVVARGLAPFKQLIDWVWPTVQKGSILLAIKGQGAKAEIDAFRESGSPQVAKCHVELLECGVGQFDPVTTVIRASEG